MGLVSRYNKRHADNTAWIFMYRSSTQRFIACSAQISCTPSGKPADLRYRHEHLVVDIKYSELPSLMRG